MIKFYVQEYSFLSNTHWDKPIEFEGQLYKTVSHAFQAAKQVNNTFQGKAYRQRVRLAKSAASASRIGRECKRRPDWDKIKVLVMREIIMSKFKDKTLQYQLTETHPVELQYGNFIHDNFWGICHCEDCWGMGRNTLGKIHMEIRKQPIGGLNE